MADNLKAGDYVIFQIESGYGLLRVLAIDGSPNDPTWHLTAFSDLFLDVEMADAALENSAGLGVAFPHLALTDRAFQSTQVARMSNSPLTAVETELLSQWNSDLNREIQDRSIRLILGLR